MKVISILTILLMLTAGLHAQGKLSVIFEQEQARSGTIPTMQHGGILYASMNDLAGLFHLQSFHSLETQKLELATKQYTLRLTANNPYVVVFDQNRTGSVLQLQHDVVYQGRTFFVPAEEFTNAFDDIMPEDIRFDASIPAIIVGKTVPASRYDITGLLTEEKDNGYLVRIQCSKPLSDYESWT